MSSSAIELRTGLEDILQRVLNGQADLLQVRKRLDELFMEFAVISPQIQEMAHRFCDELLDLVLADSLGFRVIMLAEILCRVARWSGLYGSAMTALCAHHLMTLAEVAPALALLQLDLDIQPNDGTTSGRLEEVLRANCLSTLGRFADADSCVASYESTYVVLPEDHGTIEMLIIGALAASALSKSAIAERRATLAVSMYGRIGASASAEPGFKLLTPLSVARVHAVRGRVMRESGDPLRAIEEFQRGRDQAKQHGDPSGAAFCLSEIGITWERMAEIDRASRLLNQAAAEAEACGEKERAARWRGMAVVDPEGRQDLRGYNGLAFVRARLRASPAQPDEEAEGITKAIIIEARDKDKPLEAIARNALAGCYCLRKHFHQALTQIRLAIQIADSIGDQWSGMIFRANLANTSLRANRFVEAEEAALDAVGRATKFRDLARASEVRQATAAAIANASEVLFLLWGLETTSPKEGVRPPNPNKIVELAQKVRSRNFDRWLSLMNWALKSDTEKPFQVVRALIEAEVAVEATAQAGESLSAPLQLLDSTVRAFSTVLDTTSRGTSPGDKIPGLKEALDCITGDEIVLDLNAVESGLICIVAGPRYEAKCFEIPWERKARTAWIDRWRLASGDTVCSVRQRRVRKPINWETHDLSEEEIDKMIEVSFTDLDLNFVKPLYEKIGETPKRIICATHAELFGIPLWSLARGRPDLILSIVPSVASISLLANRPASQGTRFVKIGDATGTLEMVPLELAALRSFDLLEAERFELVRELHGTQRIHFAGHGEFVETNPYMSGVIVRGELCSPYALADMDERCVRLTLQGLIRDWDVRECDLVVLSACSTGIPRAHAASEFTSVATTLLLGGARNVIAASWPADDVATMVLMSRFYEKLEEHRSPARALAEARSSLGMMNREDVSVLVHERERIPMGARPFLSPLFTDTFLHFGVN